MSKPTIFRARLLASLTLLGVLSVVAPVMAATQNSDSKKTASTASSSVKPPNLSGQVAQSYNADPGVQVGMIVQLKPKDPNTVMPLDSKTIKNLLGIVIPQSNATIVLTPQNVKQQQVLVATVGHYNVLVSNQNGAIKVGDYVTVSAINGVGMKAGEQQEQVIGKAAGAFNGTANVVGSVKLKDVTGKTIPVAIGRIALDINISHNPLFSKSADYVPGFLASIAVTVASKPVSVARIYLSSALLLMTALLTGNTIYSGIRSGMIAVGRNPLSKKSIIRSLIQTVIAGLIIFVAGVFAVYLLLKL